MAVKHEVCPFQGVVPTTSMVDNKLETRVGIVEGAVETLSRDIQQVAKTIHEISISFDSFKESLANRLTNIGRPQWPLIVSIVTMLLTILTMGGALVAFVMSGHAESIRDTQETITSVQSKLYNIEYERGKSEIQLHILINNIKTIEERQYINTGMINKLSLNEKQK